MALLDLSLVTQALQKLLLENVTRSPAWNLANTLTVSPQPPDKLKGPRTLGVYLYHLREAPHTKAQDWPAPASEPSPQRFSPMGLYLHYVVTAHSDISETNQQIYAEQLMMGLAVKTLRDFARLDDDTQVAGLTIFPPGLTGNDNRLRLLLQPIAFDEAMRFWSAGEQPLRLAAYYEVSAVLLEPEAVTSKVQRVLSYGVHSFLRGSPRLDGSRNPITFTVPGEATPRVLTLQPAEVTYGEPLTLFGSDLAGDTTSVVLSTRRFAVPVEVGSVAWGVASTGSEVTATIQPTAGVETVLPGLYTAAVRVVVNKQLPDGSTRAFVSTSNETPFAIVPRINLPVPAPAAGLWTITGDNFDPAAQPDDHIQVFAGAARLERVAAGVPAAGRFRVVNATTLRFRLPAAIPAGTVLALRLIINGAESAPLWITAT